MSRLITLLVVVAAIAAAVAAPASADSLEFEYLQGDDVTFQALQCNPEGTSSATFVVRGSAGGPHPGTFESTVTVTAGPLTFGEGRLLELSETFEILSGETLITGTKGLVLPEERFYPFACTVSPAGGCEDVFVHASAPADGLRYDATISGPEGTQQERGYAEFSINAYGTRCGGETQTTSAWMDQFFTTVIPRREPATLVLAPETAVNTVGTFHELTAAVSDESGEPVADAIVRIGVAGASSATGLCLSDVTGVCTFSYQVAEFPGEDTIRAYVDANADGVQDASEPTATATKTIVLPASTIGRATGDGKYVTQAGGEVAFTLSARSDGSTLRGSCVFKDKTRDITIKCLDVLAYVQHENAVAIYGHAEQEGVPTLYRINVVDRGQPGSDPADFISILTAAGYRSSGPVASGDVQVR
jgi:hypothetical protein